MCFVISLVPGSYQKYYCECYVLNVIKILVLLCSLLEAHPLYVESLGGWCHCVFSHSVSVWRFFSCAAFHINQIPRPSANHNT